MVSVGDGSVIGSHAILGGMRLCSSNGVLYAYVARTARLDAAQVETTA